MKTNPKNPISKNKQNKSKKSTLKIIKKLQIVKTSTFLTLKNHQKYANRKKPKITNPKINCAGIFKYKTFKSIYYVSFHKMLE